jgi:hypothetical protein
MSQQKNLGETVGQPFGTAEEAWFWFIQAQAARSEGAVTRGGMGHVIRPCEPGDIFQILDRLYRQRLLLRDHLLVLRHYGRRQFAPDPYRVKEKQAFKLWGEAFERLRPVMERKNIVVALKKETAFERLCRQTTPARHVETSFA